jgi:hypothetical protein
VDADLNEIMDLTEIAGSRKMPTISYSVRTSLFNPMRFEFIGICS